MSLGARQGPPYGEQPTPASAEGALFVYGSLSFPEVLQTVLGREPKTRPASVIHWRAAALRNRVFPGLVPAPYRRVDGLLIHGLSGREWRLLDSFEASFYDLCLLVLADGSRAWAYTCSLEAPVEERSWDRGAFAVHHVPAYLQRCAAWRMQQPPSLLRADQQTQDLLPPPAAAGA